MVAWPASIPASCWRADDFTQTPADVTLRTSMDAGPAKVRKRFTANVSPRGGSLLLTSDQAADLLAFYNTYGGFTAFDWVDPVTGAYASMRFVSPPVSRSPPATSGW